MSTGYPDLKNGERREHGEGSRARGSKGRSPEPRETQQREPEARVLRCSSSQLHHLVHQRFKGHLPCVRPGWLQGPGDASDGGLPANCQPGGRCPRAGKGGASCPRGQSSCSVRRAGSGGRGRLHGQSEENTQGPEGQVGGTRRFRPSFRGRRSLWPVVCM